MSLRIIFGLIFMFGGIAGVIWVWSPYMQMPPIPPPEFGSDEYWRMVFNSTISGSIAVIGAVLIASGRNSKNSSF